MKVRLQTVLLIVITTLMLVNVVLNVIRVFG